VFPHRKTRIKNIFTRTLRKRKNIEITLRNETYRTEYIWIYIRIHKWSWDKLDADLTVELIVTNDNYEEIRKITKRVIYLYHSYDNRA